MIIFLIEPKDTNLFGATFVSKLINKNFEKSPNLVTLIANQFSLGPNGRQFRNFLVQIMRVKNRNGQLPSH